MKNEGTTKLNWFYIFIGVIAVLGIIIFLASGEKEKIEVQENSEAQLIENNQPISSGESPVNASENQAGSNTTVDNNPVLAETETNSVVPEAAELPELNPEPVYQETIVLDPTSEEAKTREKELCSQTGGEFYENENMFGCIAKVIESE